MLKSKADGPSLDAQCTVVSLSLHFSSGDSSSCSAEALLLMVDGSKQGWVQLQGLSLPHQCSLRGTRVGKDKTGAMPSAWFSVGAIPSKTAPEPASSPSLASGETKRGQAATGSGHLCRKEKERGKKPSIAALIAGKKFPALLGEDTKSTWLRYPLCPSLWASLSFQTACCSPGPESVQV